MGGMMRGVGGRVGECALFFCLEPTPEKSHLKGSTPHLLQLHGRLLRCCLLRLHLCLLPQVALLLLRRRLWVKVSGQL